MRPRNTLPKVATTGSGSIACAFPMRKISLQRYALPDPDTEREAEYREEMGEMLRQELVAFADTMSRISNPRERERLATQAAELLAYAWAKEVKTYEQIGRVTIARVVAKRDAIAEAEYLKESGYPLN